MPDTTPTLARSLPEATAAIVMAYAGSHHFPAADLPGLISTVHGALAGLGRPPVATAPAADTPSPADVRRSVTPAALVSFLDGKRYKTLRRHLTKHGLTPETYRARFGLPVDYPMVAPSYAAQRSALAKGMGLGQRRETA